MKLFTFDFETFLIQPMRQAPPIVCMSYAWGDGEPQVVHARDHQMDEHLQFALTDPDTLMVAHNAAFEFTVMLAHRPDWAEAIAHKLQTGGVSCTKIRERLIHIGEGERGKLTSLDKSLANHGLPFVLDKTNPWRVRFGELYNKPVAEWPESAVSYSAGDVAARALWHAQAHDEYTRFLVREREEIEADVFLRLATCWGFRTNPERAKKLEAEVTKATEAAREELLAAGLVRVEKKRGVSVYVKEQKLAKVRLEAAYRALGVAPPRGEPTAGMFNKACEAAGVTLRTTRDNPTKDEIEEAMGLGVAPSALLGNISLDEEACLGAQDHMLTKYTEYSQAATLLAKVRRLQYPRIQASFNVLGAVTGRTSCSMGDDPKPGEGYTSWGFQLQNPPRVTGIRDVFEADPGHALVSIDFDSFELRTLSQQAFRLFGYSKMREVLMDPSRCPHVEFGAVASGMTAADGYALKKTNKAKYKEIRQVGKLGNFGAPGGLGAKTFVEFARTGYDLNITEERAKELLDMWRETWPEMAQYLDWCGEELRRQDPKARAEKRQARGVSEIVGEGFLAGNIGYCDFANRQFQGLAAIAAKRGVVALGYAMYVDRDSGIYGCRLLNFVHDEVILQIPLDGLHEKAHRARDIFVAAAQTKVPDVTLTASPSAMINWTKAASDPCYDAQGTLIPYEWSL